MNYATGHSPPVVECEINHATERAPTRQKVPEIMHLPLGHNVGRRFQRRGVANFAIGGRQALDTPGRRGVAVNCVRRTERAETIDVRYRRCVE